MTHRPELTGGTTDGGEGRREGMLALAVWASRSGPCTCQAGTPPLGNTPRQNEKERTCSQGKVS